MTLHVHEECEKGFPYLHIVIEEEDDEEDIGEEGEEGRDREYLRERGKRSVYEEVRRGEKR